MHKMKSLKRTDPFRALLFACRFLGVNLLLCSLFLTVSTGFEMNDASAEETAEEDDLPLDAGSALPGPPRLAAPTDAIESSQSGVIRAGRRSGSSEYFPNEEAPL